MFFISEIWFLYFFLFYLLMFLGIHLRIPCQSWSQKDLPLCFLLIVLCLWQLLFRWLIHVLFCFVNIWSEAGVPGTVFCSWVPRCPSVCWRESCFFIEWSCFFVKISLMWMLDSFLHFQFCPSVFLFICVPVPLCSDYCDFTVSFEGRESISLPRFVLLTVSFSHLGSLLVPVMGCSSFGLCHKVISNFDRNCTESVSLWEYWHSNSINSCIYEQEILQVFAHRMC